MIDRLAELAKEVTVEVVSSLIVAAIMKMLNKSKNS